MDHSPSRYDSHRPCACDDCGGAPWQTHGVSWHELSQGDSDSGVFAAGLSAGLCGDKLETGRSIRMETDQTPPPVNTLEAEAVYILRETAAEFRRPALLYSAGKDSSVLLRLAQKAFAPGKIPFALLHVDTSYKFAEMIEFRDRTARELGLELIVHRNEAALAQGANPFDLGTEQCCRLLKTQALRDALKLHGIDAAIGGARREEERSRAKERIFSIRDGQGHWDPRSQRPEVWNLYNCRLG